MTIEYECRLVRLLDLCNYSMDKGKKEVHVVVSWPMASR